MKNKLLQYTLIIIGIIFLVFCVIAISDYFSKQESQRKLENKILTEKLNETTKRLETIETEKAKKELTTAEIAKEWSPQVPKIVCYWFYSDGELSATMSGSGFLTDLTDMEISVMTNKHIILDSEGFVAEFCMIFFLDDENYTIYESNEDFYYSPSKDKALLVLSGISQKTRDLVKIRRGYYCTKRPDIGEKIVVLGYPGIGSGEGITATEGIISGYDGDYYIVSAKMDVGNSGGIAVSVKDNCIIGMPSASRGGGLESLGRILSSRVLIGE